MAARQPGHRFVMPEKKMQAYKRISWSRLIIAIFILAFVVSAVILLLHGAFLGSWSNILIITFSSLGILIAFAQWFLPASSEPSSPVSLPQQTLIPQSRIETASNQIPSIVVQVPPLMEQAVKQTFKSPISDKAAFRSIIGLPPPADPKTIEQRQNIVKEIYEKLIQPDTTAVVLTGIGGLGKSTLAALVFRYARELRSQGKGLFEKSLWLNIDSTVTINDLTGTLLEAFGKPMPDLSNLVPQNQVVVLFNILNSADQPWLVVLDQFDTLLDGQTGHVLLDHPGIGEWLDIVNSQTCTCRILLTSRLWPRGIHEYPPTYMHEYSVRGLEVAEGIELLRKQGVDATEVDLHTAVKRCEGHALALTLLASLLRRNRSLSLTDFFKDSMYTQLWTGDIARNMLDYIYTKQLDEDQRKLLLAFSIYDKAVPLEAVHVIADILDTQLAPALDVLLVQHLLQATGKGLYQLNAIVASYAQSHFDETSEQANQQALWVAHTKAAQYYLSHARIACPPRKERRGINDVQPLLDGIWHLCHAAQWQQAYNLMEKEGIFEDLKHWGANTSLLELYQLLLPLEKWHPKSKEAICIYSNLGRLCRTVGQRERAKHYLELALSICREVGNRKEEGAVLSFLGSVYADLGQLEHAKERLMQALQIRREIEDRNGVGWTLANLGRLYDELGQAEEALTYCNQSLMILRDVRNRRGEERTLNILGHIYGNLGQNKEARDCYEQALDICREIKDRLGEGLTLNGLSLVYVDLGQWDKALQYLDQSLEIRREVGDRGGEGRTLNNLGRVYRIQGRTELAWQYLNQAIYVCKEIEDRLGEDRVLNNMGLLYYDQHRNVQALECLEQALKICQEVGDLPCMGWTLHNLGRVHDGFGETEQSQKCYEQAFEIRKKVGDRKGVGWTLHNLAVLYYNLHRYELALAALLVAQKIFEDVRSPAYSNVQASIGNLQSKIGEEEFTILLSKIKPQADQIVEQALSVRA